MEVFSQMLWPLLACFILVGIHAYLGIHVIARKIIFVDLALAQIAGLGAVYGIFLGLSFESNLLVIKLISIMFTLLGALLVAMTRSDDERVPHEALIGIIYASALSLTVLLTSNLPHGAEEVQQMLAGSILWVSPAEVLQTGILYTLIGLIHIIFRRQFFQLSYEISSKATLSCAMKWWDFLFYATFGVVVTSSVGMGGVLLVFGYLVIPSVIGVIIAERLWARLFIAWLSGLMMSIIGVVVSYYADLPSGPCIVVLLALLLVIVNVIYKKSWPVFSQAFLWLLIIIILIISSPYIKKIIGQQYEDQHALRHQLEHHQEDSKNQERVIKHMLSSSSTSENIDGLNALNKEMIKLLPDVAALLAHKDALVRERAVQVIGTMSWHEGLVNLIKAFKQERDDYIKIEIAESVLNLGDKQGFIMLARIWRTAKSALAQDDVLIHIRKWLAYDVQQSSALIKFIEAKNEKLEFDKKSSKYIIK